MMSKQATAASTPGMKLTVELSWRAPNGSNASVTSTATADTSSGPRWSALSLVNDMVPCSGRRVHHLTIKVRRRRTRCALRPRDS